MSTLQILTQLNRKIITKFGPIIPILCCIVVWCNRKDTVSSDSHIELLIVSLKLSVEIRKLSFDQLVLESDMQLELKSFFGSCGELPWLSTTFIRILNYQVSSWIFDKGVENTNIMKPASQDSVFVDALVKISLDYSVFCSFYALQRNSNIND